MENPGQGHAWIADTYYVKDMKQNRTHRDKLVGVNPMRLRLLSALLALGLINPVMAAPTGGLDTAPVVKVQFQKTPNRTEPEVKLDPMVSLQALSAYLTPDDINELSLYLRDVVVDILRGTQDATLPPDLAFKLAVLKKRFCKEGDVYMQQALRNLDRDLRRFLQGLPVPVQLPEFRTAVGE